MAAVKHPARLLRRIAPTFSMALALLLGCSSSGQDAAALATTTETTASVAPPPVVTPATAALPATASATAAPAPSMDPRAFVPAPVPEKTTVAVIGGGFAGLIAAYKLREAGVEVHVLEAAPRIGGRVNTAYYPGGAQGEFGFQELWEDNPIYKIAQKLGVQFEEHGKGEPAYSSFLYEEEVPGQKGKHHPVLYSYAEAEQKQFFQTFVSKDGKPSTDAYAAFEKWLASAGELRKRAMEKGLADPEIKKLQKTSFGAWVRDAKLDPKFEEFIAMTSDCEIGVTWEEYSALFGVLEFGLFLDELHNYHAAGGNHKIPEALAAAIGPHVTTGAKVVRIDLPLKDKPGKGEIAVQYMIDGHIGVLRADRVVLAVPWIRLHELDIRPGLSKEKWDALDGERDTGSSKKAQLPGLSRGKYTVVHLLVDRKQGDALWRNKTTKKTPFPVLSNGKLGVIYGVRGEGDPTSDTDVFSLLVYGEFARALHMEPVERVEDMTVTELERIWPGFKRIVKGSYVYSYHPAGVPVWPPGRSPIDDASKGMWKPEHGLYLAGDYLLNAHSDGAARSAICQADRIALDLAGKPAPTGLCYYIPQKAP